MNEQREQQQRSPMSHCPMLYYHYLFSCFRFHSISLTAISISSNWPNKIRSRSRHQVQIGDDLAMDEANSILMRANDQVTIMIWSSCRLWRWFWKAIWMQLVLVRTKWWQSPGDHFLDFKWSLHFPDHQGFICLWCDRQWPSVGRWLQWNWNITGQNLPTLIGAISWNFIFQFKSLSNAGPPNGLLDIKVSTPCLYISIQGGLMMRGVVQRCPQPPMRFYL